MTGTRRQDKTQRQKGITHGSIEFRRKASVAPTECLSCLTSAFFSRHPLRRHAHAQSSNQRGAQRFHRHHRNVHGVFQRPHIAPSAETSINRIPIPIGFRQLTPSRSLLCYPHQYREKPSTGFGVTDRDALRNGSMLCQAASLIITGRS